MKKDVIVYKDYVGSVRYSSEDEVFLARSREYTITFEGESVLQLKEAFHEAVQDYIEIARANGKEPEKTYRGSLNIRLKPDVHRKANRLALLKGKTLNQFINDAIEQEIGNCKETVSK